MNELLQQMERFNGILLATTNPLQQLVQLTPLLTAGDFQAVARQARFRPLASADAFVAELQKALQLKGGGSVVMPEVTNRRQ